MKVGCNSNDLSETRILICVEALGKAVESLKNIASICCSLTGQSCQHNREKLFKVYLLAESSGYRGHGSSCLSDLNSAWLCGGCSAVHHLVLHTVPLCLCPVPVSTFLSFVPFSIL